MKTICLNPKVGGKQPKVEHRIYSAEGLSTAVTTCFMPSIGVIELNKNPKHQQDCIQHEDGLCRTLCVGCHGYMPHLTKTAIKEKQMEKRLRIRKLTEGECIRLMGFESKDTESMREAGLSKSIIYHSAGDSIVTTCLVGIFGQLLGKDHRKITEEYSDRLSDEGKAEGNL